MGKRVFVVLGAVSFVLGLVSVSNASISYDATLSSNAIYGAGNSNILFTVDREGDLELGLRAHTRYPTPLDDAARVLSQSNGTYGSFEAQGYTSGGAPGGPRGSWNFDWSINTNSSGMGSDNVNAYTYLLEVDFDPTLGHSFTSFDPVFPPFAFPDNSYGNNSTPNDGSAPEGDAATYASTNNVVQNSTNLAFLPGVPAFDPTADGVYTIRLSALIPRTGVLAGSVDIDVVVGAGAPVPEATSFAIWGLLGLVGGGLTWSRAR